MVSAGWIDYPGLLMPWQGERKSCRLRLRPRLKDQNWADTPGVCQEE